MAILMGVPCRLATVSASVTSPLQAKKKKKERENERMRERERERERQRERERERNNNNMSSKEFSLHATSLGKEERERIKGNVLPNFFLLAIFRQQSILSGGNWTRIKEAF